MSTATRNEGILLKIIGRTFYQFLPIFIDEFRPEIKISLVNISTIMDLYEAYSIVSLNQDRQDRVTEEEVIRQSGLSETVFHSYFRDLDDMEDSLKQMVLSHSEKNIEVFRSCFRGQLSLLEVIEIIDMTRSFAPFVNSLFRNVPDSEREYRDRFIEMLSVFSQDDRLPPDIRAFLYQAITTSYISLAGTENGKSNNLTVYNTLNYIVRILQNISTFSIKISPEKQLAE